MSAQLATSVSLVSVSSADLLALFAAIDPRTVLLVTAQAALNSFTKSVATLIVPLDQDPQPGN